MAIRRVGAKRKRYATRTANPRKKKRVVRRKRRTAKRRNGAWQKTAKRRNGTKKGMVRKTARRAYKKPVRRRRRKNPMHGKLLTVAGIDMGVVALGTVGAVVIKNGLNKLPGVSNLIGMLPAALQPLASPALVITAGWAINKYAKNKTFKQIGQYAAVAALVLAVDDFAEKQFGNLFGGAYHNYGGTWSTSMSGAHDKMSGMHEGMGGMHMDLGTGGAFVALPNPQHIGSSSMFGGITNLA